MRKTLGRVLAGSLLLLGVSSTALALTNLTKGVAVPGGVELASGNADGLQPDQDQARVTRTILQVLDHEHYGEVPVDDAFSKEILDRYLDVLDPFRASLLAQDVAEFEARFATKMDDAVLVGDLKPAFEIYNRFSDGLRDQIRFDQESLTAGLDQLDFTVDEGLELDRTEGAWPTSEAELHELWRKRFKNDVLVLRLDDKSPEEIQTTLDKRYKNQARRLSETNSGDVFNLFINVVTGGFDPHTNYFPPRDAERFDMMMSLSFQGIGAELTSDGEFAKVVRLIPGGPAEKSGLVHATDRIVAVGQDRKGEMQDVVGWRLDDVVDLIRGPAGTIVRLGLRPAESVDGSQVIELERDEVKLEEQAASSEVLEIERQGKNYKVGVIDLPAFYIDFAAARAGDPNFRSSTRDVAEQIVKLEKQGVDGIVLDLRGNGGGSLTEAQNLSGLFLGPGPVVQVRGDDGEVQVLGSEQPSFYDGPLVVLVDRLSASASEILAGAVQDRGRGLIVGTQTFGKGTVQTIEPLADGQIKLTQAKFYRVTGASTQDMGVHPDIEFPSEYDLEEVGESALPGALPWDQIKGISGRKGWSERRLDLLRSKHAARAASDQAFVQELRGARLMEQMRSRSEVSLNETERKAQIEHDEAMLLELANARRVDRGLEPVASLDDVRADESTPALDVFAKEASQVVLDLGSFSRVVLR